MKKLKKIIILFSIVSFGFLQANKLDKALWQAINKQNVEEVKKILEQSKKNRFKKVHIDRQDPFTNMSPLHSVCFKIAKIREEISNKEENNEDEKETEIKEKKVTEQNYENIAKLLIEYGADVNLRCKSGTTPLFMLCRKEKSNLKLIKYLIEKGANVNILHQLCDECTSNKKVIKILMKNGAHFNATDIFKKNFLNIKLIPTNKTAIEILCSEFNKNIDNIKLLLKYGAKVNTLKQNKPNLLHRACKFFNYPSNFLEHLLKAGINVNSKLIQNDYSKNIDGPNFDKLYNQGNNYKTISKTPLQIAYTVASKQKSESDILKFLLKNGANSNLEELNNSSSKCLNKKEYKNLIKDLSPQYSLFRDFSEFFKESQNDPSYKKFANLEIRDFKINPLILFARLGKEYLKDKSLQEKAKKILEKEDKETLKMFFNWVHGISIKECELNLILPILKKLNILDKEIKHGIKGLKTLLKNLYFCKSSKDFKIIVKNKEIKTHKIVLFIRSGLFRKMFLSIKDEIEQVNDYSEKSYSTINALINFLYMDSFFRQKLDLNKIEEFEDVAEYYQLETNSNMNLELKKRLKKIKKIKENKNIIKNEKVRELQTSLFFGTPKEIRKISKKESIHSNEIRTKKNTKPLKEKSGILAIINLKELLKNPKQLKNFSEKKANKTLKRTKKLESKLTKKYLKSKKLNGELTKDMIEFLLDKLKLENITVLDENDPFENIDKKALKNYRNNGEPLHIIFKCKKTWIVVYMTQKGMFFLSSHKLVNIQYLYGLYDFILKLN